MKFILICLIFMPFYSLAQTVNSTTGTTTPQASTDSENLNSDRNYLLFESGYWSRRLVDRTKKFKWIGFSSGSSSLGVFSTAVINYGSWEENVGPEYSFGLTRAQDSFADTNSTTTDSVNHTQTTQVSASGTKNAYSLTLGYAYNMKSYQNPWIMVYWGPVFGVQYTPVVKYATGTTTTTIPDTTNPATYTVQDSSRGEITKKTDMLYSAGVRIGSEFYLKWFPDMSLGFATGLMTGFGGDQTTTTETVSQNQTTTNGTPQTPTSSSQTSQTSKNRYNVSYNTFGIGGTTFNLFGTFTIKYIW